MSAMTITLLAGALVMGVAGGLTFLLAVRTGQLDDVEDTKYQMLQESDDHAERDA